MRRRKFIAGLGSAAAWPAVEANCQGEEFDTAIEDMLLCVTIRNQYAHCIWHMT
jgi:hypothetical protein